LHLRVGIEALRQLHGEAQLLDVALAHRLWQVVCARTAALPLSRSRNGSAARAPWSAHMGEHHAEQGAQMSTDDMSALSAKMRSS